MERGLKIAVAAVTAGILAIGGAALSKRGDSAPESPHAATPPKPKGYALSPTETALMEILAEEEIRTFSEGGDTVLGEVLGLSRVTAGEVASAYLENEVKADRAYKGKLLLVTGQINGIQSGLNDEPFLTLRGKNPFMSPQAKFKDGADARIAELRKGQSITLVCTGGGELAATAFFRECEFADSYSRREWSSEKDKLRLMLAGKTPVPKVYAIWLVSIVGVASQLPDQGACVVASARDLRAGSGNRVDVDNCVSKTVEPTMQKLQDPVFLRQTVKLLRARGVQILDT